MDRSNCEHVAKQRDLTNRRVRGHFVAQFLRRRSRGVGEPGGPGSSCIRATRIDTYCSSAHNTAGNIEVVIVAGEPRKKNTPICLSFSGGDPPKTGGGEKE